MLASPAMRAAALAAALLGARARAAPALSADAALYAFAIRGANQTGELASTALIDAVSGAVRYTAESFNHGSDAFCSTAFRKSPASYFVPSFLKDGDKVKVQLQTIGAGTGHVDHAVNLSVFYSWPAAAYDDETGLLWAIAIPENGGSDIITVHAATGTVEVVKAQIGLPDIQLCEAAFFNDQFFFAWMDDTSQIICTWDVASQQLSQRHYVMCPGECRGGMNTIVPYLPDPSVNETHLLAMAVYGGPGAPTPQVISIDPAVDDSITVLATCPEDTISSPQGAGAYDPVNRNFYNVMLYTNNTGGIDVFYQLITTNVDKPAYEITRIVEPGKPANPPAVELWSIDVGAK